MNKLIILIPIFLLFLVLFITFFPYKKFVNFLLSPFPIFGAQITKILSVFIGYKNLESICNLKFAAEKRFTNPNSVPIIIISSNFPVFFSLDSFSQKEVSDKMTWVLNNNNIFVFTDDQNLKEICSLLSQVFDHGGFHSMVFMEKIDDVSLLSQRLFLAQSIVKNLKIHMPCFYMLESDLPCDFSFVNNNLEEEVFENFINSLGEKISLESMEGFNKILSNANNFKKIRDTMSDYSGFKGVLVTYRVPDLENFDVVKKLDFVSTFANETITDAMPNVRRADFIKNLTVIISILISIFFIFQVKVSNEKILNMENSLKITEQVLQKTIKDDNRILEKIRHLDYEKLRYFRIFQSEYTNDLKHLQNYLILHGGQMFTEEESFVENTTFTQSPVLTTNFANLQKKVESVSDAINDIYEYIKFYNKEAVFKEKITEYMDIARNKILQNFKMFFDSWEYFLPIQEAKKISSLISSMAQAEEISMNSLRFLNENIENLRNSCTESNNQWWNSEDLGSFYLTLLNKIKKIPEIGDSLVNEIENMKKTRCAVMKSVIIDFDNYVIGKFFSLYGDRLCFSNELNYFSGSCKKILSSEFAYESPFKNELMEPDNNQISLWDISSLEKALNLIDSKNSIISSCSNCNSFALKIFSKSIDWQLKKQIVSSIVEAQNLTIFTSNLETFCENISKAEEILKKIKNVAKRTLYLHLDEVDKLLNDSTKKIAIKANEIFESTIYTSYNRIENWNGSNLSEFLFQVVPNEIIFLLNKNVKFISDLINIIRPILPRLSNSDKTLFFIFKNILEQIESYSFGRGGDISAFEDFLNGIGVWEIKYRDEIKQIPPKTDFFRYNLIMYKKTLIERTNFLHFFNTQREYNEIVKFFNNNLAGFFPFGHGEDINIKVLQRFLEKYKTAREKIYSNKSFTALIPEELEKIENIANTFLLNNNDVISRININFHVEQEESKNQNLIIRYRSIFGPNLYDKESVDIDYKLFSPFSLEIKIADSSVMQIRHGTPNRVNNKTIIFNFPTSIGLFRFIKEFKYKSEPNGVLLRINVPIETNEEKDQIVTFVRVNGLWTTPSVLEYLK